MKTHEQLKLEMYGLIHRWEISGLNQKEFCSQEGINYYKFKYWKSRQSKEQGSVEPKQPTSQPGFIPITVPENRSTMSGLEITFPNGVKLNFSQGLEPSQLIKLINLF